MSKCVQCGKFFGPNFCVVVDENNGAAKCAFCYLDKNEITMVDDESKKEVKITKEYAEQMYMKYLKEIYNKKNIQELIKPTSRIIMP